jgi:methylmalonyl-CoA/ethylmalonyl-CoA epimerase
MGLSDIGPVMQIAFVPGDFNAAIAHWTQVMGVGPFYLIENIKLPDSLYLGQPNECVFSIAIAYWGNMQIELIRQENDAPSIYRNAAGQGMHHSCILTKDLAKARAIAEAAGAKVLVEGRVDPDGAVLYVDTGGGPGTIVEILQPASGTLAVFDVIKAAGRDWDGSDPVRRLG